MPHPEEKANKIPTANPMWGGHFASGPAEIMQQINASIDVDKRLWQQDIAGSLAHVAMLGKQRILTASQVEEITVGLKQVEAEIASGNFSFSTALEDIHMNIEARLKEIVGEHAGRLHTARSRNDQVATDFRLWVRDSTDALLAMITDFRAALLEKATPHTSTIMPGFTHLQSAQPVTFGHHLMAYHEMLGRDAGRFRDARKRLNECPLGAAALAGTSFPIDRHFTAEKLGFAAPMRNSLDAVSDRDFALEFMFAASLTAIHLSRFAEEIILWCSDGFKFITLSDAFTSGSSIMPQKRNPDAAELVRAKVGSITGSLITLLMVMKGLPLAYSKDMQEDKPPVFAAFDALSLSLQAMSGMVRDMQVNEANMLAAAQKGYATATDIADWLVRELGLPFRECHHITGRIVAYAEGKKCRLDELSLAEMQAIEPRITQGLMQFLSVENSVNSRKSYGGTAPENVQAVIREARS